MNEITTNTILNDVCKIIEQGRRQAYAAANQIVILTYWHIGQRIVEEEQHGEARAQYGKRLIKTLAEQLVPKYGSAFSKRNLEYIHQFYLCFSDLAIVNTRVHNLTWSHFRTITQVADTAANSKIVNARVHNLTQSHFRTMIQVADPKTREWYAKEAKAGLYYKTELQKLFFLEQYGKEDVQ